MTPQGLKNSILQLAIQGKLVEQRPEEGTAAELVEKILAAKNAKGAKKNLTRSRGARGENKTSALSASPRGKIPDDEKPFDIPESWEWVRLKEITTKITDGTHHSPPNQETGDFMYVTAKNIKDEGVIVSNITYVSADVHAEIFARCNPELGDILLIKDGATTGVVTVNNIDRPFSLLSSVALLKLPENICAWYLVYALRSDLFYKLLRKQMKGTGITRITLKQIEPLLIPLPPLAEQKRIVAKIEELLPYIDRYEKAWSKLEDFNKRFPGDMQKSLLQMAIQGKLVEQRAEEGTAAELLEKILAAKNAKGAKKNLTRSRGARGENKTSATSASPREKIPDDEKTFDIPESWEWCLVGDVFNHNTGKAMNSSAKAAPKSGTVRKFITTSNVYWNSFDLSSLKEMFFSDDELERCSAKKNDILMCEGGAYYGRAAIWKNDYDICFQNHIHRLRPYVPICEEFFYYVFFFYRNNGMMKPKGTAMPGLSSIALHNLLIPLPPLAEQKRIVAKLEELLPLCERLK